MSDEQAPMGATGDPITDSLTEFFKSAENPSQVENSEVVETPEVVEVPAEPEPEQIEEPKEEPTEEPAEEAATTEDEESEEEVVEFLSAEQIKEKFPRNSSKGLIAYAAQMADKAKVGTEAVAAIGGEAFVEPLAKMSTALQAQTPEELSKFFEGVVETAGTGALLTVLGQALYMGFEKSDEWAKNPETAMLGESIQAMVEASVQAKYGTSSADLVKMAQWAKVGWFDKLDQWIKDEYVPEDELDDMLKINSDPVYKRLAEENYALKQQQEKKTSTEEKGRADNVEVDWGVYAAEQVRNGLKVEWTKSPLRDIETDAPEMKERKAFFRQVLESQAIEEFNKNTSKAQLLADFRSGKQHTSVFRKNVTDTMDSTLKAVRPNKALAEGMLAKLYGNTRNGQLLHKPVPPADSAPLQPTVPTDFKPQKGNMTMAEIDKSLEEAFVANG